MRNDEVDILACYRQDIGNLPKGEYSLVLSNLPLVISIARSYSSSQVPLLDLIQAGNLGLMRAAQKFDPQLGFQFSTYATRWIRLFMLRLILRQSTALSIPFYLLERLPSFRKARESKRKAGNSEPTVEQLAEELDCSREEIGLLQEVERYQTAAVSLEVHQFEDGTSFADLLVDADEQPEAREALRQRNTELSALLSEVLSEEERRVVSLHICCGLTFSDIGKKLGRAHETIHRIHDRALLKLRRGASERHLEDFL